MIKNLPKLGILLLVTLITGCAKYNSHPLNRPVTAEEIGDVHGETITMNDDLGAIVEMDDDDKKHACKKKNDLTVIAHTLSEGDCRYYFGRKIINKGYRPIKLFIKNDGPEKYVFNASSINLPVESRDKVADKLHLDPVPRVLGWAIAGLLCWPFLIPAAVECIKVPEANKALDSDFDQKVIDFDSRYEIKPGAVFNKVFFVREDEFDNKLKLGLISSKTKDIRSFGVTL